MAILQVSRNVSFGGGGKAPLNKEEVKLCLLNFALADGKLLSVLRLALKGIFKRPPPHDKRGRQPRLIQLGLVENLLVSA